jgi:hypothetical protein
MAAVVFLCKGSRAERAVHSLESARKRSRRLRRQLRRHHSGASERCHGIYPVGTGQLRAGFFVGAFGPADARVLGPDRELEVKRS